MRSAVFIAVTVCLGAACQPHHARVSFDMRPASPPVTDGVPSPAAGESYSPVSGRAALILGCGTESGSPVCSTALPTPEEDSAFIAEGNRLLSHRDARCRRLGGAILENESSVRMYPKALMKTAAGERLYGVGHAYEIDNVWLVRVARRVDDLNERTLEEKKRTLRHEMSHTIGARETAGWGWTAEDYASHCG